MEEQSEVERDLDDRLARDIAEGILTLEDIARRHGISTGGLSGFGSVIGRRRLWRSETPIMAVSRRTLAGRCVCCPPPYHEGGGAANRIPGERPRTGSATESWLCLASLCHGLRGD